MTCVHDLHWRDERIHEMPRCEVHVDCDEGCKALTEPVTLAEFEAACEHWRHHGYLSGCSHGN